MRARDIMSSPVVTVTTGTPVREAEKLLAERGFTGCPVLDDDERLAGMVTEADFLADRFPAEPSAPGRVVGDVMTTPAMTADVESNVAELARTMLEHGIRTIPVLDRGELAGVVSRRDFLRALARADQVLARDIRDRLAVFGGRARWIVDVRDGQATIIDRFDSEQDRQVAVVLAEGVPGVLGARCHVGEVTR
ncbi:HPP family protein [Amycolatopsis sp. NPDC059657]|uniref:CBS domain-containing protein n=1 Tax=Amycolatopsis sp. NPDC059657 TaxID=3346899 RepID=UPI00367086B1